MSSSRGGRLPFVVHATPAMGGLPASDVESLYLIALAQASLGGDAGDGRRWGVASGDHAANGGALPYVTHLDHLISNRHLPNLPAWKDVDESLGLDDEQRAEGLSWRAYIEQSLTDLVYHTMYSLPPNYPALIAPAQVTGLGPLEKQYIPQRIRGIHKARLEHVGLWGIGGLNEGDAQDADGTRRTPLDESFIVGPAGTQAPRAWSGWRSGREEEKRRRMRGEEELRQRVRSVCGVLERRLGKQGGGRYFFGERPSTVDLYLLAHLSLLFVPPYPNRLVSNVIRAEFPLLTQHHDSLTSSLFPTGWSSIPIVPIPSGGSSTHVPQGSLVETFRSYLPVSLGGIPSAVPSEGGTESDNKPKVKKTEAEKRFDRGRWAFYIGAGAAMVGYLLAAGIVQIELGETVEWEGEDEQVEGDLEQGEAGEVVGEEAEAEEDDAEE